MCQASLQQCASVLVLRREQEHVACALAAKQKLENKQSSVYRHQSSVQVPRAHIELSLDVLLVLLQALVVLDCRAVRCRCRGGGGLLLRGDIVGVVREHPQGDATPDFSVVRLRLKVQRPAQRHVPFCSGIARMTVQPSGQLALAVVACAALWKWQSVVC